jgi:hypothetical protein
MGYAVSTRNRGLAREEAKLRALLPERLIETESSRSLAMAGYFLESRVEDRWA